MIYLPWPAKELSPNSRCHWAIKAKAAKKARRLAGLETMASGIKIAGKSHIDLFVVFHAPDKRLRDLDNCIASLKSTLDGIADGLHVNDRLFRLHFQFGEVKEGGVISIEIKET